MKHKIIIKDNDIIFDNKEFKNALNYENKRSQFRYLEDIIECYKNENSMNHCYKFFRRKFNDKDQLLLKTYSRFSNEDFWTLFSYDKECNVVWR